MTDLLDRINQLKKTCRPRPTFTLERGRGETYSHPRPVLYAHSIYGRGSVLAGQPRRLWVAQWDTWEEARAALTEVTRQIGPSGSRTSGRAAAPRISRRRC